MTGIVVFIAFYILAALAGTWGDVILAKCRAASSLLFRFAFGGCTVILVSLAVSTVCSVAKAPAGVCMAASAAAVLVTCILGLIVKMRTYPGISYDIKRPRMSGILICAGVVITVLAQVYVAVNFAYGGTGPLKHAGIATAVFESGRTFLSDPMMTLTGCIAYLTGIHPLKIMYTYMPPVMITLYYLCYLALINAVCTGRRSRITAFIAVCVLNVWGYQSQILTQADLLLSWFGIWVFVIHGLLNIAAVVVFRYINGLPDEDKERQDAGDEDTLEEWDMNRHKIINARNLAIALGVLAAALIGVVVFLNHKINRLYDATVNLQTDMNNKCSVYEFVPEGGTTEGFLIRGSDGSLSFIGGGGAENADELELFISKYGSAVTNWYVYGDDDETSGAMKKLTGSGTIGADRVYVIDRKEITDIK